MTTLTQRSFAGGEISPVLWSRVDTVKHQTGLRTMRNFFTKKSGGAQNRPGTQWVTEIKDSTNPVRLIKFVFSNTQAYVLEFGNLYVRFIQNGQYVNVGGSPEVITGITQANPAVVTSAAHGLANGQQIIISGVVGMTQVNNRTFVVAGATTNTYQLHYLGGAAVDSTGFGAYVSGGLVNLPLEVVTPYVTADIPNLKYVQSADVMTIVHPNYAPRELARFSQTIWTLTSVAAPTPKSVTPTIFSVGGSVMHNPGFVTSTLTITGITNANPPVVTSAAHGLGNGQQVTISGVVGISLYGLSGVNGRTYVVAGATTNTFTLQNPPYPGGTLPDFSAYNAYSSGGTITITDKVFYVVTAVDANSYEESLQSLTCSAAGDGSPTQANIILSVLPSTGVSTYNFYKGYSINGPFGLVNRSTYNGYSDFGDTPNYLIQPPNFTPLFNSAGNYPSCVTYAQQRLIYANTNNNPEKVWGSKIGHFHNFTTRFPLQDDDSISWVSAGRQVNSVKNLIELNNLIILTQAGEFAVLGGNLGELTPTTLNPRQNSYNGSNDLAPIAIDNLAIYVQSQSSIVRDLAFDWQIDGYHGNDITTFSSHLFEGFTLNDWDYQKIPDSLIWAARSDGTLLGCTYIREQQILAWHRHDFQGGFVENVCCIPEGSITAVYFTIKRTVNGRSVRYIERFTTRFVNDVRDCIFMDAALSYDGRNVTATSMTFSSPTGWTHTDHQTVTASASFFASTAVGDQLWFYDPVTGDEVRFVITAYTSATVVTVQPEKTVSTALQTLLLAGTTTWSFAVNTLLGLWHLEGQQVSVLADGFVVANPNNTDYSTILTVTNGSITLPHPQAVVHVGLPITADMETLDIDTPNSETLTGKHMFIGKVYIQVEKTRGLFVGDKMPLVAEPGDPALDPLAGLIEFKVREYEGYSSPIDLQTGKEYVAIDGQWNTSGRVFIRQIDPLPASVLSVMADGYVPIRQVGT